MSGVREFDLSLERERKNDKKKESYLQADWRGSCHFHHVQRDSERDETTVRRPKARDRRAVQVGTRKSRTFSHARTVEIRKGEGPCDGRDD